MTAVDPNINYSLLHYLLPAWAGRQTIWRAFDLHSLLEKPEILVQIRDKMIVEVEKNKAKEGTYSVTDIDPLDYTTWWKFMYTTGG